ncbi:hypothetical protein HK096_002280 [Nowakowskiella sp. JEL0078]|nr:hypothetical protein HK096_002280 [Nowakowskiella sp. JEL0078]
MVRALENSLDIGLHKKHYRPEVGDFRNKEDEEDGNDDSQDSLSELSSKSQPSSNSQASGSDSVKSENDDESIHVDYSTLPIEISFWKHHVTRQRL